MFNICFLSSLYCRGGDSTHRGPIAEPLGAATSIVILHKIYIFDATAKIALPVRFALAIIHDGNTCILMLIPAFDDADLCSV